MTDEGQHPDRRRPAREAAGLPDASSRSWARTSSRARSGRGGAARRSSSSEFAVILLDVNMPGMDGFETAALIRQRQAVGPHADHLHHRLRRRDAAPREGYALGAVDYILSPVVPEILRAKVRVFVDLFRMTQQVRRQAEERVALAEERTDARGGRGGQPPARPSSPRPAGSWPGRSTRGHRSRPWPGWPSPSWPTSAGLTLAGEPARPWQTELAWVVPGRPGPDAGGSGRRGGRATTCGPAVDRVLAGGQTGRLDGLDVAYPARRPAGAGRPPSARPSSCRCGPAAGRSAP